MSVRGTGERHAGAFAARGAVPRRQEEGARQTDHGMSAHHREQVGRHVHLCRGGRGGDGRGKSVLRRDVGEHGLQGLEMGLPAATAQGGKPNEPREAALDGWGALSGTNHLRAGLSGQHFGDSQLLRELFAVVYGVSHQQTQTVGDDGSVAAGLPRGTVPGRGAVYATGREHVWKERETVLRA